MTLTLTWYQWLSVFTAIIAIFTTGLKVGIWYYKRQIAPKPFDQIVTEDFTYRDVKAGIEKLVDFANRSNPQEIVAINRGGTILGGLIGKHLGLVPRIIEIDANRRRLWFCDRDLEELCGKRVLLVDDRFADGKHMLTAQKYLEPNVKSLRSIVFAWVQDRARVDFKPDEKAYKVDHEKRLFPWEPPAGPKAIDFTRRPDSNAVYQFD
jgi:hypoxanthine phosphoribosyltransferase